MDFVKQHGDQGTHKAGDHHRNQQRNAHAPGDQKRGHPRIAFAHVDIDAQKSQCHNTQASAVEKADPHLLGKQRQFIPQGELFIHKDADGNGQ